MSTRRRIDWIAAKAVFVQDPERSFGKVARQFGVSDTAVRGPTSNGPASAIGDDQQDLLSREVQVPSQSKQRP